jgi:hypothetical protein
LVFHRHSSRQLLLGLVDDLAPDLVKELREFLVWGSLGCSYTFLFARLKGFRDAAEPVRRAARVLGNSASLPWPSSREAPLRRTWDSGIESSPYM